MKRLWFKNKRYGWGWTPCTWEGWTVLAVYLAVLFGFTSWAQSWMSVAREASGLQIAEFLIPMFVWTGALFAVCWKMGEKPRWRWGKDT